jgi:hypothetical protein
LLMAKVEEHPLRVEVSRRDDRPGIWPDVILVNSVVVARRWVGKHPESPGRSLARQLLWTPAAPFFGGRGGPRPSEPLPPLVLFDLRRYRRSHDPLR